MPITRSQNPDLQPHEELERLRSKVDFIAEQQAAQTEYLDFLMQKLCKDAVALGKSGKQIKVPSSMKRHIRGDSEQVDAPSTSGSVQQPTLADVLGGVGGIDEPQSPGTKPNSDLQEKVAWKWRWAAAAWKAKVLSQRLKDLENSRLANDTSKENVTAQNRTRGINKMNLLGRDQDTKACGSDLAQEKDKYANRIVTSAVDSTSGFLARVEDLEKQMSQMSTCFSKMVPTVIYLVERAGNKKLLDKCFSEWRNLSSQSQADLKPEQSTTRGLPQKCEKRGTRSFELTRRPKGQDAKKPPRNKKEAPLSKKKQQQNSSRRASPVADSKKQIQCKQRSGPLVLAAPSSIQEVGSRDSNCTSKALHALQASLRHELEELQRLLSGEMEALHKQVDDQQSRRRRSCGGNNWKTALVNVWEICNSVALLLNHTRARLRSNGQDSYIPPPPIPRQLASAHHYHPRCTRQLVNVGPPPSSPPPRSLVLRVARDIPTSPIRKGNPTVQIVSPSVPPATNAAPSAQPPSMKRAVIRLTPSSNGPCSIRINPVPNTPHVRDFQVWRGRDCVAAQHAESLRRQIDYLRTRHELACARLIEHQQAHPLPTKPQTPLPMQHTVTV